MCGGGGSKPKASKPKAPAKKPIYLNEDSKIQKTSRGGSGIRTSSERGARRGTGIAGFLNMLISGVNAGGSGRTGVNVPRDKGK